MSSFKLASQETNLNDAINSFSSCTLFSDQSTNPKHFKKKSSIKLNWSSLTTILTDTTGSIFSFFINGRKNCAQLTFLSQRHYIHYP